MDPYARDPDPQIAAAEDRFTDALSTFLYRVQQSAIAALGLVTLAKADNPNRAARLFAELISQPAHARKAEDLADALTQDWAEKGLIKGEAERAVRAGYLRGEIEAARAVGRPLPRQDDPAHATLNYGITRACIHVTKLQASTRALLAGAVVDALLRGDQPGQLATEIVSRFGTLNRDARRLAITEIAFARANGFLASVQPGSQVAWMTATGCCPHCERLNGRVFTVRAEPGDPETEVWAGKHSVGLKTGVRSPSIPFHPNCRCRWVLRAAPGRAGVNPEFAARLREMLQD